MGLISFNYTPFKRSPLHNQRLNQPRLPIKTQTTYSHRSNDLVAMIVRIGRLFGALYSVLRFKRKLDTLSWFRILLYPKDLML